MRGAKVILLLIVALSSGCARFPANPTPGGVARVIVELRLDGRVKPEYLYFAIINFSNDSFGAEGPLPVVQPPWGNGFAAGAFTHFVLYSGVRGGYGLFQGSPLITLDASIPLGPPSSFEPVGTDSRILRFEVDLTQFIPDVDDARAMRFAQVNLMCADRAPIDPHDQASRFWEAFGDGRSPADLSRFITIRLDQNRIYRNVDFAQLEPSGDVPDPDLDLIDWSIEVRTLE